MRVTLKILKKRLTSARSRSAKDFFTLIETKLTHSCYSVNSVFLVDD
jgi:hypothetical protein